MHKFKNKSKCFDIVELNRMFSTTRQVIEAKWDEVSSIVQQSTNVERKFETKLFLPTGENRKGEGGLRTKGYFKVGGIIPVNEPLHLVPQSSRNEEQIYFLIPNASTKMKPLITIVTVVFNGEQFLEETILSVINQTYENVEYIVIDGGSNDGTLDIIKKYENAIDYWVSEKDSGIYDAMNKGIVLTMGRCVNFMNAGDKFFENQTLSKLPFVLNENSPLIYGNKIHDGKVIYPMSIKKLEFGEIMACHQSMFFNLAAKFVDEVFYDLSYKIYSDYELVNRLYLKFSGFKYLDQTIAVFQGGGVSSMASAQKRKDKYLVVLKQYGIFGLFKSIIYRLLK